MSTTETEDVLHKRVTLMENGRKLSYFTFGDDAGDGSETQAEPTDEESASNE
jgi:hypothetical protein